MSFAITDLISLLTASKLTRKQINTISKDVAEVVIQSSSTLSILEAFLRPRTYSTEINKVDKAKQNIAEASAIISELQSDLENQAKQLETLAGEIEKKKADADRYTKLAETGREAFAAIKIELEDTVRKELVAQVEKGKWARRGLALLGWIITLILGGLVGAYIQFRYEAQFKKFVNQGGTVISQPSKSTDNPPRQVTPEPRNTP